MNFFKINEKYYISVIFIDDITMDLSITFAEVYRNIFKVMYQNHLK